ncbi:MAG: PQQ-binding-like beta-propeller repeat protein [Acidobacteriota bacterium]
MLTERLSIAGIRIRVCLLLLTVFATLPAVAADSTADADALWQAAEDGDTAAITRLLDAGVEIDAERRYGVTALLIASAKGHLDAVELLLERGASVDAVDTFWGTNALSRALQGSHFDVAQVLAESGVPAGTQTLLMSIAMQRPELARTLLSARESVYAFERDDALAILRTNGPSELVEVFEGLDVKDEVPVVAMNAEQLDGYVGPYGVHGEDDDPDDVFHVRAVEGGLEVTSKGMEPLRLAPIDERHFRSTPEPSIGVWFLSRAGLIDGMVVMQRGLPPRNLRKKDDIGVEVARSAPTADGTAPRAVAARQAARPWPSFRGASASGLADGQGAISHWDLATGDNVRWTVELPGLGLSSPVIWGDRLFVTTARSGSGEGDDLTPGLSGTPAAVGDNSPHTWQVIAIDTADGSIAWEQTVGEAEPKAQRHIKSSHANPTPVTDGERVISVFPTAGMVAHRVADGKELWRVDLGGLSSGTDDKLFQWGFASSPILWRDLVIVQVDIHDGSYIAAWDAATGASRWRTERDEIPGWATPTIYEKGDHAELITNANTIRGYDPRTGDELWTLGPSSEIVIATPIIAHDLIYITAGYPPIRAIYAVRPGQKGDLTLTDGATSSDAIAWSHRRGGGYMPTPIVVDDLFYMPHHAGKLVAYEAKTGEMVYRARFSQRGALTGSPIAADGLIYFTTEDGLVYVVEAGRTYREIAVHEMGEPILTTPALSDGTLYIRGARHLWALGATGESDSTPNAARSVESD